MQHFNSLGQIVDQYKRALVAQALLDHGSNYMRAAAMCGVHSRTFGRWIKQVGIDRETSIEQLQRFATIVFPQPQDLKNVLSAPITQQEQQETVTIQ